MRNTDKQLFFLLLTAALAMPALADQNYSQQVFFDNSLSPGSYFYSEGKASAPSVLKLADGKLPIETSTFPSGPNAIELQWQSMAAGSWEGELHLYAWRNRYVDFPGRYLYLWFYAPEGMRAQALRKMALRDLDGGFTQPLSLAAYTGDLKPGRWTRVRIPLTGYKTASLHAFEPRHLSVVAFVQGAADQAPHTLFVDDIRVEDAPGAAQHAPATPGNVRAKGYERHIDITWDPVRNPALAQYVIYRSTGGGPFRAIGVQRPGVDRYCDYLGDPHATASYRVSARTSSLAESPLSAVATASTHPMTDDELLSMVEEASLRYYMEANEPHSGMTRENTPGDDDIIAVGASGFGIMAMIAGADRGFLTRQQAIDRLLRITAFLETADRYHGVWPHFLSGSTGHTLPVFGMFEERGTA